jgi:hypothetical protein
MSTQNLHNETYTQLIHAALVLSAAANGQYMPPIVNIFGETMDASAQVDNAKLIVRRFADVYC